MKLSELTDFLDNSVPLSFQEDYDNSGLQTGDPAMEVNSALLALDATERVVEEATACGISLIITHHPLIFHPVRSLTGKTGTERVLMKAVKTGTAIYSAHTNLDAAGDGVSFRMAKKLGLKNVTVLSPLMNRLMKLVTYVPISHIEKVRDALFSSGAGVIGNYDSCSFNSEGYGTFRGGDNTNPFTGERNKLHRESEVRIETILLSHQKMKVIEALHKSHPYEEVAYDLYNLENEYHGGGYGCVGELMDVIPATGFLEQLKSVFSAGVVKYSQPAGKSIKKVALCGGSGSALLERAISSGADAFVTADVKYHRFFDAEGRILLADIGHFESEKFTMEIIHDLIIKKFPTFALRFSETNTNPINYL